jgi:hypothetical protein
LVPLAEEQILQVITRLVVFQQEKITQIIPLGLEFSNKELITS